VWEDGVWEVQRGEYVDHGSFEAPASVPNELRCVREDPVLSAGGERGVCGCGHGRVWQRAIWECLGRGGTQNFVKISEDSYNYFA
jgi:hypothetical protein